MPKSADGKGGNADRQLQADVRAFAAELGLSGGGESAFDDFAPEKARKKIGQQKGGRKQQEGKTGGGGQQGDRQQQPARKGDRQEHQQQKGGREPGQKPWQQHKQQGQRKDGRQQQQHQQRQHSRWGGGGDDGDAAPTPKVPNAKSILPRDEPAIWHEAASTLPALPAPKSEAAPEVVQQRRSQAERLLLVEEQVCAAACCAQRAWQWQLHHDARVEVQLGTLTGVLARCALHAAAPPPACLATAPALPGGWRPRPHRSGGGRGLP